MEKQNTPVFTAQVFGMSGWAAYYVAVIYLVGVLLGLLLLLLFKFLLPDMIHAGWMLAWQSVVLLSVFASYFLLGFRKIHLGPDRVTVTCLGVTVRSIPVSQLQLFCMAGNDREDVMCLCARSLEEMAALEENKLLRNYFSKHEVPLRKRSGNWQNRFARDYLNRLRRNPFAACADQKVILISVHPTLQRIIRALYPQLPYRNYTNMENEVFIVQQPNRVPSYTLQTAEQTISLEEDAVRIHAKKGIVWQLPAQQVRTIVRVDCFNAYSKYFAHHTPFLLISRLRVEELAAAAPNALFGVSTDELPVEQELLAMEYCRTQIVHWSAKNTDMCPMYYTTNNAQQLRRLYPHARWVDLSLHWIEDGEGCAQDRVHYHDEGGPGCGHGHGE